MHKKHLAEKAVETVVEKKKEKAKKKLKRKLRRVFCGVLGGFALLGTGYFLGVHHRVLAAMIKGRELPEAPKGHCLHR